jgi:hypothetical protein
MPRTLLTMLLSIIPALAFTGSATAGQGFACDMRAMTKEERTRHAALAAELFASVQERKDLANGYALRLPAERWLDVARWAELERKCCPFFAFELDLAADRGPLWLRITGRAGVKEFMKQELGL